MLATSQTLRDHFIYVYDQLSRTFIHPRETDVNRKYINLPCRPKTREKNKGMRQIHCLSDISITYFVLDDAQWMRNRNREK